MHTGVLDKNWIRNFFRSIGYPIGPPSKLYEHKQASITIVLVDRITPQSRPLDVLINDFHELHLSKIFDMVDIISNMGLDNLNYKPHGGKSHINIIDCAIGSRFYPPTGSEQYKLIHLDQFHGTSHINCVQENKSDIGMMRISNTRNSTTNTHTNHIKKDRAFFVSFNYTDMNIKMIKNHPHFSVLISFICTENNNRMTVKNSCISTTENKSPKMRASCHSVMSTSPYNYKYKDKPVQTCT